MNIWSGPYNNKQASSALSLMRADPSYTMQMNNITLGDCGTTIWKVPDYPINCKEQ